ncbi:TetR/AcrR family transcriptional regulator [uncultured Ferrovibrio sp.]|jgi:AcrR family transcriptional regulator|uniref:TetR/AcrR family transcriptional regulator n=1 Tax=uncultured Ferrovibrio sp. TaxID=1576913 RepID=UPI002604686C|nr:TetR/AcrR family transcriptional regulator [uncultured Ferrovibrio sp.]
MGKAKASRQTGKTARRRLSRDERHRQLMEMAWTLIREEGSDALTLGRLAERSGVTKPVVYDHFGMRAGLLAALYREFDVRQTELMDAALAASAPTLDDRASVIAAAFVDCVLSQGREIPGVIAALAGSPELEAVRRECEAVYLEKCRAALAPFAGPRGITLAGLRAMAGAAEALSDAAANGEITPQQAKDELRAVIMAMVQRQ